MISSTGKGLTLVVECQNRLDHNHMAFAGWFSLHKYLPDCDLLLMCRRNPCAHQLYLWTSRVGVKLFYFSSKYEVGDSVQSNRLVDADQKIVFLDHPYFAACRLIRNQEKLDFSNLDEDIDTAFVQYRTGIGKFVPSQWINRQDAPFNRASERFAVSDSNANELKVLRMWEQSQPIFESVK